MEPKSTATPIASARILAASLMGALVVIGIALSFVVSSGSTRRGQTMPVWPYLVIVLLAAALALVVQLAGYRVPALPAELGPDELRTRTLAAFTQSMIIRFALCESVALVSIVLTFLTEPRSVQVYYLGGAASLVLMAYHVWPGRRVIERVEQGLDRDGAHSGLTEILAA